MKIEEYQALAMRTSPEGHDRVLNGCLGLIGESGEIVDIVKKWKFQSGENAELPKDKLIDECGDVLWYCAELCQGVETNLASVIENHDRLYPEPCSMRSIIHSAYYLATTCIRPYGDLDCADAFEVDDAFKETERRRNWRRDNGKFTIGCIVNYVRHILIRFCGASLEEAMERNIEKLKRRYPDGFDPERSLHRPEYEIVGEEIDEYADPSGFLFEMRNRTI